MESDNVKKVLSEQLQLLAERSKECTLDHDLKELTIAMCSIASVLR